MTRYSLSIMNFYLLLLVLFAVFGCVFQESSYPPASEFKKEENSSKLTVEMSDNNTSSLNVSVLSSQDTKQLTSAVSPMYGPCQIFPNDNPWNTDISSYPVHPDSDKFLSRLNLTWRLQAFMIKPFNIVNSSQPKIPIYYTRYGRTSDPGPMPIPFNATFMQKKPGKNSFGQDKILTDNHLMVVDVDDCMLYELWNISGPNQDGSWNAGSGAIYNLSSNQLRSYYSASAAASGLPVFAGLIRSDEVKTGAINHALSMTTTYTQEGFILPAISYQGPYYPNDPEFFHPYNPPMGLRLRLKQDYNISDLPLQAKIIATALKKYGAFVTDGSPGAGQMTGNPDPYWVFSDLTALNSIPAEAFEVVYTGPIIKSEIQDGVPHEIP